MKYSQWRSSIILLAHSLSLFFPEVSPGSSNLIVRYSRYCPDFTFLRQETIKFSLECTFQYNFLILAAMVREPLVNHSWSRMSFGSLEWGHGLHVGYHKSDFCNVKCINKMNVKSPLSHHLNKWINLWWLFVSEVVQMNINLFLSNNPLVRF